MSNKQRKSKKSRLHFPDVKNISKLAKVDKKQKIPDRNMKFINYRIDLAPDNMSTLILNLSRNRYRQDLEISSRNNLLLPTLVFVDTLEQVTKFQAEASIFFLFD